MSNDNPNDDDEDGYVIPSEDEADKGQYKKDLASNPDYDNDRSRQNKDDEEITRIRWGRRMSLGAYLFMGLISAVFFFSAIGFAAYFIYNYDARMSVFFSAGSDQQPPPLVELLLPFIPVGVFSLTGLLVLITGARFTRSFAGDSSEEDDEYAIFGRLVREVVTAIRSGNTGGN